jgi:hypothetical protein
MRANAEARRTERKAGRRESFALARSRGGGGFEFGVADR